MQQSFSIEEAILSGWHVFKTRPWFFIGVTLLTAVVGGIGRGLGNNATPPIFISLLFAVIWLVASIANFILSIGSQKIFLKSMAGEKPEFQEIFKHGNLFVPILLGAILYALIVVAGLIFFIIPGVFLALMYSFQYLLMIDKGLGPVAALKESARLTKGARWKLFFFGITLGCVNVVGALCLAVGLLVSIPVTNLAIVHVYRKLLERNANAPATSPVAN